MQVRYTLLAVAWTLLASCEVAVGQGALRQPTTEQANQPIESFRSLRSHSTSDKDVEDATDNGEERVKFDVTKLVQKAQIDDALQDATKKDELFTSWAKSEWISKNVIKELRRNPVMKKPLQTKRFIQQFRKFKREAAAKADKLLSNPKQIEANLKDFDSREEMFKTWFANEAVSDSIVAKLSTEFEKNKHILLPFNDYRTKHVYGEKLGGWLKTSELDSIHEGMQVSGMAQMRKTFGEWYKLGKTGDDLKAAFKDRPDLEKKYKMITVAYPSYIKTQVKEKERLEMLAHLAKAQGGDR